MKKSTSFPTIVLLLLLCLAAPLSSAYAEIQGVATVIALRGSVVAQGKDGTARNLSIKSQIFQEDVLKTDKTGQLQIMFTDNSIISLGRDSEMKIAEYRWQPEQKDGALRTQAKEGTFRVMGGALAKEAPQNFKTETPTATIGIRGSMYTFNSTADSLSIVFQGGKGIEVFNSLGKVAITTPGFGTHVVLNTAPRYPAKFTEKELNNLNRQLNGDSGNDKKDSSNGVPPAAKAFLQPLVPPVPGEVPKPIPTPKVEPKTNELPSAPNFTPPMALPTDGVFAFNGLLGGISYNPSTGAVHDTFANNLSFGVNWHNKRLLGVAYDIKGDEPVFFFGSVTGATISDLTIIGIDELYQSLDPGFISGSGVGVFTGAANDQFTFAATGNTYRIQDSTLHDTWVVGGVAQKTSTIVPSAPTGSSNWQGFVTGLSTDMTNPYTNYIGIYQSGMGGIDITLDKDTGTISGTINPGGDYNAYFNTLTNLQVGGSTANSVYVRDDLMAALISGCVGDCNPSTLKPYGNVMVTALPQDQVSSYVTWGYWGIAYTENGIDRIMVPSSSMWIAGKPTPISDMTNLNGYKGTYTGKAFGTEFSASGAVPIIGTLILNADFTNGWVDGNITFPMITLPFSSVAITTNTYAGSISNGSNISGSIKGAFFGPDASATGNTFNAADTSTNKAYLGISGGTRGALSTSPIN